jgi:hypothetical protein
LPHCDIIPSGEAGSYLLWMNPKSSILGPLNHDFRRFLAA